MQDTNPDPAAPLYIVLNAGSGSSETALRRATIEGILAQAGRSFELAMVDAPGQLEQVAKRMVAQARAAGGIVVAAGGDGTINTVARETVASGCPFGVLPQGTFNYFGRTHNIPEDLGDAVRALLTARVQPVQIGIVNQRIFLVNASIGLYPTLLEEREADKHQFGRSRLVALLSALKTFFSPHRRMRIKMVLDGMERSLRTSTLFVGNNRLQMEQLGMAPMVEAIKDGELAAIAIKSVGKLGMFGLLARALVGRLGDAGNLLTFSFRQMTVRPRKFYGKRKVKVATDGEVTLMDMPLEFRVLEGQLLLLKPGAGTARVAAGDDRAA
ncbi:diacylglycerol/lipid kinase family protein [Massilia cavernae]|uniref:Diacylglycerol kinase n=1 Tax=Massilia cavernae TaxID=2320864 RepID=A0A418Y894_9BURK|nr:diacylglycerol kinase family protein [Massilia cavernae]RJG27466.1 diacylglycerol kinase [Massilia cavernae]